MAERGALLEPKREKEKHGTYQRWLAAGLLVTCVDRLPLSDVDVHECEQLQRCHRQPSDVRGSGLLTIPPSLACLHVLASVVQGVFVVRIL